MSGLKPTLGMPQMNVADYEDYVDEIPWLMAAFRSLPGIQPLQDAPIFMPAEDYASQMTLKAELLERGEPVMAKADSLGAGTLSKVLDFLWGVVGKTPGFASMSPTQMRRPDGGIVERDEDDPLRCLAHLVQEDICVLEKREPQHVMTAALLCFPASWTLAQKIGRPLDRIHRPVPEYPEIAARVQRLFDGVQAGRPMWRANALWYPSDALFTPMQEGEEREIVPDFTGWLRSERQVILRVPGSDIVLFIIRTKLAKARRGGDA